MPAWYQQDPSNIPLDQANDILKDPQSRKRFPNQFKALLASVEQQVAELQARAEEDNRIAFCQPSYEQTLKLNCWMGGYDFIADFDANRIGKTASAIFNLLLWAIAICHDWQMFRPFIDHLGRQFVVLPRPPLSAVREIKKFLARTKLQYNPQLQFDHPENLETSKSVLEFIRTTKFLPNRKKRIFWFGCPTAKFYEDIIIPEFKKWCPTNIIDKLSEYDGKAKLSPDPEDPSSRLTVIFKTYESDDTTWSGAAVDGIILTEGFGKSVFHEVRQRFKYPGAFGSWDYTPYEPRNGGAKTALAFQCFTDPTKLPLTPVIFTGMGIDDAPTYILDEDKKADLIKNWGSSPEGEARLKGIFYTSSPIILKNYDPTIHALDWSLEDLQAHYAPRPLVLFRGIDPGWGHVTACVWMALAPDNTRYIYRVYSESQRSIEERCQDIIELSGNRRILKPGTKDKWIEIPKPRDPSLPPTFHQSTGIKSTWIDYHTFKTDENTKQPFALNYIRNGLLVKASVTIGPKERATLLNNLFQPQAHLAHPITKKPKGAKIYVLLKGDGVAAAMQKITSLFWATFDKGEKQGLTKDTPQDYDDDELDAFCYVSLPVVTYDSYFHAKPNTDSAGAGSRISYTEGVQFTS